MGDIGAGLTDMWRSVLLFLPKAIAFLAILVVGWIVATAVRRVVDRLLERVGFDRAVQRGGVGRALERSRYDASDILARLAYYALLLLTLQLAFGVWGPNPISDLISGIVAWLPKAFVAIVIVVVSAAIASAVKELITGALGGLSYGRLVANLASWFIIGLGVIAALNQVGIATTVTTPVLIAALATVAGILIVGVGGGLVRPMTQRWDRWLARAESESQVIRQRAQSYAAGRDDLDRQVAERTGAQTTPPVTGQEPAMAGATAGTVEAAETTVGTTGGRTGGRGDKGGRGQKGGRGRPNSAPDQLGGGHTYESGNAAGGAIDDTQRIDPDAGSRS